MALLVSIRWPSFQSLRCLSVIRSSSRCNSRRRDVSHKWQYEHHRHMSTSGGGNGEKPWRILFFGTDEFSLPHLQALNQNRIESKSPAVKSIEVLIPKATKSKRSKFQYPVEEYANYHDLPLHVWPVSPPSPGHYDVGVTASFGHLLPLALIQAFPHGILNVHPSLLPRWRGSSPLSYTVLSGDRETGVTIMHILPHKFDVGPILLQNKIAVPAETTTLELRNIMAAHGSSMLVHALEELESLKATATPQTTTGATLAKKLTSTNARVNWEMQCVDDVVRQYRALNHMFSLRSIWQGHAVRLEAMVPPDEVRELVATTPDMQKGCPPGTPHFNKKAQTLCIRCVDGWVGFKHVVIRTPMSAKAFYNGHLDKGRTQDVFSSQTNRLERFFTGHSHDRAMESQGAADIQPCLHN